MRFLTILIVVSAIGCTNDPRERPMTWSYLHAAIIVPSCVTASCHSAVAATAGLPLDDADDAYAQLLARDFVIPGDPSSALMSLLEGNERRRMPPDAPLPHADIELIRAWIEEGSPR